MVILNLAVFVSYILAFVVIISVIVFVHEFGHYFFAKIFGVKVEEFSIGFGKELFGFNDKSGTRWKFCLIPAGGYVKLFGDTNEASTPDSAMLTAFTDEEKSKTLHFKKTYQKMLIVLGGPFANFIFSMIILLGFYLSIGKPFVNPVITAIVQDSPAMKYGLQAGDRILKMDNTNIVWFDDISRFVALNTGEEIEITLLRNSEVHIIHLKPEIVKANDSLGNEIDMAKIGILSDRLAYSELGFLQALKFSVLEVKNVITSTMKILWQIAVGKRDSSAIGGPIRIAKYSAQSFDKGMITVLWFMAMLSINLGLINLFPIPVLDGGHFIFYIIEAIKGGAVALKYQEYAAKVGLAIIAAIFLFATFNDVRSFFK